MWPAGKCVSTRWEETACYVCLNVFAVFDGFPLLKRSDFLACFIMEIFSCEISAKLEAQDNAWSSKFSEIDG